MKKTFLFFVIWACFLPALTFAQNTVKPTEYQLLAPLPGYVKTTAENKTTAGPYIEGIFTLVIALAGGLAVLKIIFGGIKYMSTDAFSGKSEAKGTIENAIWGLLLAISDQVAVNKQKLVYLVSLGQEAKDKALSILANLRNEGIACDTDFEGKSLKGAMRKANDLAASFVLIIGDDEIKNNVVTIKDMVSGVQNQVKSEDLITSLMVKLEITNN